MHNVNPQVIRTYSIWYAGPLTTTFILYWIAQFIISNDQLSDFIFYLFVGPSLLWQLYQFKRDDWRSLGVYFQFISPLLLWMPLTLIWQPDVQMHHVSDMLRHTLCNVAFILCCHVFFNTNPNRAERNRMFWNFGIIAATANAVLSLIFYDFSTLTQRLIPFGQLDQSIHGASVLGITFLFAAYYGYHTDKMTSKILYVIACTFIGISIFLTYSRGPLLALCISLGLMAAFMLRFKAITGFIGISIVAICLTAWLYPELPSMLQQNLLQRGGSYRAEIWTETWQNILQRPLLGWGAEYMFKFTYEGYRFAHPHNLFLGTWFYSGLLGLLLLLAMLANIFVSIMRTNDKERGFLISLFAHCILSVVTDTSQVITAPSPFWLFFWLPICYLNTSKKVALMRPPLSA